MEQEIGDRGGTYYDLEERLLIKVGLAGDATTSLLNETEELIRIFAASIRTAESNARR